jgi:MSHA biogenesis protein MshL
MKTLSKPLSVLMLSLGLAACANNPLMQKQSINTKAQEALKEGAQIAKGQALPMPKEISDELFESPKVEPAKSLAKKVEPRFDLVVTKAPVSQVLMGIVSGTPYSMVLHPDMAGEISVNLKDVTLFEALNSLRELYGLEYKMNGKQIYVEPQTLQTRVFQVNYITGSRKGSSGTKVSSGTISNTTNNNQSASAIVATPATTTTNEQSFASDVSMTSDNDFWGDIAGSLDSLIGKEGGRKLIINKQSGLIMVKAMPKEIRQVEKFLKLMQVTVDRQVILEAKIIKVELNDGSQQGINWTMFRRASDHNVSFGNVSGGTTLGTTGNLTTSSITSNLTSLANATGTGVSAVGNSMFAVALQGAKFSALLNFLETQGNVEVLSSPRIATINNQKAVLKVGTDAFFVTNVRTNVTASAGGAPVVTPDIQMQPYFSGISLDVTPQIDQDDNITLHVHPLISEVTQVNRTVTLSAASGGTYTIPTASSKINETDSIVRTRDGNVIAIGGLMTESSTRERSKIPGLGDVKGLGNLFRQKVEASTKSELVILLKSTVVRSGDNWAQDMLETQERIEKLKGEDF